MNTLLLLLCQWHQLPPVIDASLITPVTHVNQGSMLLKLIGWRHCPCFRWVPCILGTTTQTPGAEPGPTARYSGNMYNMYNRNKNRTGVSITPREPCSETLFRLRNLYPRSTQNTDVVSSINFFNSGISCLMVMLFISSGLIKVHVT